MPVDCTVDGGPYRVSQKPEAKFSIKVEISMKSGKVHTTGLVGVLESDVNRKVSDILRIFMEEDERGDARHPHKTLVRPQDRDKYRDYWPAKFRKERLCSIWTKKFEPVVFLKPDEIESLSYHVVPEEEEKTAL